MTDNTSHTTGGGRSKSMALPADIELEHLSSPAATPSPLPPVTQSLPVSSIPTSSSATDEKKNVPSRKRFPIILAILLLALSGGVYGVYSCTQSAKEKRVREEFAQAEMMNQLAHEKAKKDAQDKLKSMGITDYDEAILKYYDNPETLQLLITAGADVNKADKDGKTPLYWAARKGLTECVKLLQAAPGIDVNKANMKGETPLYRAARNGRTECAKLLLAAPGIDVNKADKDGDTPLYEAAWRGHTEIVKLLLAAPGIDISNWNALSIAVLKNDCNTIIQLLQSGADVNKADMYGFTPLYWAAGMGHTECVKLLLAAPGIDVNKAYKYGETPLYQAADNGHTEIVKLLLAAPGIDINKADKHGKTPLFRAGWNGHTEIVELLRAAGAKE